MSMPDFLRADPARQEAFDRLWVMTADERVAAMYAGELSLQQCLRWASSRPDEVPLLHGEFWFLAIKEPDIAEHRERMTASGQRRAR